MEPLQPASASTSNQRQPASRNQLLVGIGLALSMLASVSGCLPDSFTTDSSKVYGIPCQVHSRWQHQIQFPSDQSGLRDGDPVPTIAGRVYLFPTELATPVLSEGTMIVYLYNDMPDAREKDVVLEQWVFSTKLMKELQRHDPIGWGYTVPLPWYTYKPEITRVRLKVRFDRVGAATPLYSDMVSLTFETQPHERTEIAHTHTGPMVPKNGQVLTLAPQSGIPTAGAAGTGQLVVPTNGQLLLPPGAPQFGQQAGGNTDYSNQPGTTITKSPAPVGDGVPYVVPGAGNR
jgi:hypothetical protein